MTFVYMFKLIGRFALSIGKIEFPPKARGMANGVKFKIGGRHIRRGNTQKRYSLNKL